MMQTGMNRPRINEMGKSHLLNAPQALKNRMADQFQYQGMADGDKTIHRIVDDFLRTCAHDVFDFVKRSQIQAQI